MTKREKLKCLKQSKCRYEGKSYKGKKQSIHWLLRKKQDEKQEN